MQTHATVVGNIISDFDQVRTPDGTLRVTFRVATSGRRFDRTTGTWVGRDRLVVQVVCWRHHAENVLASLTKGDPVAVTGRLYTHEYVVGDRPQSRTCLDATTVAADLSRCRVVLTRTPRTSDRAAGPEAEGSTGHGAAASDDDVPEPAEQLTPQAAG